jgi:hypothetical protein
LKRAENTGCGDIVVAGRGRGNPGPSQGFFI